MIKKLLGEFLLEKGLLTEAQLRIALSTQAKQTGDKKRLGDVLVSLGFINKDLLENLLEHGFERILDLDLDESLLGILPSDFLKRHNLFPLRKEDKKGTPKIWFASIEKERLDLADDLKFMLSGEWGFILWSEEDIRATLEHFFPSPAATAQKHTMFDADLARAEEPSVLAEAPINRLVNTMMEEGIKRRASDIHVEPLRDRLRVRYRIDGVLQEVAGPPIHVQGAMLSRIKLLAGMDIAEKRLPQDGRISFSFQTKTIDFRVSSLPSAFGESLTLRILDKAKFLLNLDELGFLAEDHHVFDHVMGLANGLVLLTGPTGSGKTTTVYSLLNNANHRDKKIITVEDPVEYELKGISQVQVKEKIGLTFAHTLRSILRQAPNVIMIGEIRDMDTAATVIQAALTGHLVISTLHTDDVPGAVARLMDMGIQPYKIASALHVVAAQRLVRRICKNCQISYVPSDSERAQLQLKPGDRLYRGEGCEACLGTGYWGRVGLFETLLVDHSVKDMIFEQASSHVRDALKSKVKKSLRQDGAAKVRLGWTTPGEVNRVLGPADFALGGMG